MSTVSNQSLVATYSIDYYALESDMWVTYCGVIAELSAISADIDMDR
jgi:hypothetical protein